MVKYISAKILAVGGHSLKYSGSWDNETVMKDFTDDEMRNFTITKQIILESNNKDEVSKKEFELIRAYNSNDPLIGYNRNPCKTNK